MSDISANKSVATGLLYYLLSVALCIVCNFTLQFYQALCSLNASRSIHDNLLSNVLVATLSWHDSQPSGRKINRFSQDIATLDSTVMDNLRAFLYCLISTARVILVISILIPLLIPFLIPVVIYNYFVSSRYIHVSRELKRLESVNKSPVFVLFSETVSGLSVIRSFRHEERFFQLCCDYIDTANR